MSVPCAQCPSHALGSETASLCVECGAASVAGAGFSVPALIFLGVITVGIAISVRALRSRAAMKLTRGVLVTG